ncbi:MAG TPA: phage tail protein [Solirubrobacteraceae bacterium]|jgi:phage tail-like protein|nr:phage tail protein [Solirubrobacteraceae bacterium]
MSSTDLVPVASTAAPASVSARRALRHELPAIYREEPFAMAFVEALEYVLDPIGTLLDCLPAHFDSELAPDYLLVAIAHWLGVDELETEPPERRRETLADAGELARRRGTRAGMELALSLFFPDLPLRVQDHGLVTVSTEDGPAPEAPAPLFDVYCDSTPPQEVQLALAQTIDRWKPASVRVRLRVKRASK